MSVAARGKQTPLKPSAARFSVTRNASFRRSAAVGVGRAARALPHSPPANSSTASSPTPRSPSCWRRRLRRRPRAWSCGGATCTSKAERIAARAGVGEHPPPVRGDLPSLLRLARRVAWSPADRRRSRCRRDRCAAARARRLRAALRRVVGTGALAPSREGRRARRRCDDPSRRLPQHSEAVASPTIRLIGH